MSTPRSIPASVGTGVHQPPIVERRRSRRRRLRDTNEVSLYGTGSEVEWTGVGTLLNANPDGIGCRVSEPTARALAIGQQVRAVFRIGASSAVFDLKARITNITKNRTTNSVLLGLEFVADHRLKSVRTNLLVSLRCAAD